MNFLRCTLVRHYSALHRLEQRQQGVQQMGAGARPHSGIQVLPINTDGRRKAPGNLLSGITIQTDGRRGGTGDVARR
jgi:hypothetical protein